MRKIVFTDIDDTLYFDGKMNPKNVEAINKARKNGHLVFINTGRSSGIIYDELMHGLFDGVVASIGAEVYIGDKTLSKEVIPSKEVRKFTEEFLAENRTFVMEATKDSILRSIKNTDENAPLLSEMRGIDCTKLYVEGKPSDEQIKRISEFYQLYIHSWYFEFAIKGCTKATGMEQVLSYYGMDKSDCITIGDSVNDLDMMKASGNPVCVENAVQAVKDICIYQTCHARDGALWDCFSHFGLI